MIDRALVDRIKARDAENLCRTCGADLDEDQFCPVCGLVTVIDRAAAQDLVRDTGGGPEGAE